MVDLQPETERLVQEEIQRGHFHSVDEVIVQGVYALREKSKATPAPRVDLARISPTSSLNRLSPDRKSTWKDSGTTVVRLICEKVSPGHQCLVAKMVQAVVACWL